MKTFVVVASLLALMVASAEAKEKNSPVPAVKIFSYKGYFRDAFGNQRETWCHMSIKKMLGASKKLENYVEIDKCDDERANSPYPSMPLDRALINMKKFPYTTKETVRAVRLPNGNLYIY